MAQTLARTVVVLDAENKRLQASLEQAERQMDSYARQTRRALDLVEKSFDNTGATIARFARGLVSFAAAGALVNSIRNISSEIDNLEKVSARANISVELLQQLQFAGSEFNVTADRINDAVSRLNRRFGLFRTQGGGAAAAAFEEIGISQERAVSEFSNTEQVLLEVIDSIQQYESAADRSALASQFFGEEAGPQLALLLAEGEGGLESLLDRIAETNNILTTESVQAIAEYETAWTQTMNKLQSIWRSGFVFLFNQLKSASEFIRENFGTPEGDEFARQVGELAPIAQPGAPGTRRRGGGGGRGGTGAGQAGPPAAPRVPADLGPSVAQVFDTQFAAITAFAPTAINATEGIADNIDRAARSTEEWGDSLNQVEKAANDLGFVFESRLEDAIIGLIDRTTQARDVIIGLAQDIARVVVRRTATEPLGQAISSLISVLGSGVTNNFIDARGSSGVTEAQFNAVLNATSNNFNAATNAAFADSLARGGQLTQLR